MASKKKLHLYRPLKRPIATETHRTKQKVRTQPSDPKSIERGVRQLLADKVSGTMVGAWLLIPEHLRLGTWDLLKGWSGMADGQVEPRLALQLVNESALCVNGIRMKRTLSQKGFELANGLPFVATDPAIHFLLNEHTVADAQRLQIALGKVRRSLGHFKGNLLAIDPHRMASFSKRQMVRRQKDRESKPSKMAQTFFCFDAESTQPLCFTNASSATTVAQASPELLTMAGEILTPKAGKPLVLADNEHYSVELFDWACAHSHFDILTPMPYNSAVLQKLRELPENAFTRHWAGYATAKSRYQLTRSNHGPYHQFIQRKGETANDYDFKAFLCTSDRDEMQDLSANYPQRWHIEEFFKSHQALGWHRAGTMNLNIRYGQMSMALIAQGACAMVRNRIGAPVSKWDAEHLAKDFFRGLQGDIRVRKDTIVLTYYNAPNTPVMKKNYENLPQKLLREGVSPNIPWLYGFKLDFRFK